jgi:CheY-like chemotaxis protein
MALANVGFPVSPRLRGGLPTEEGPAIADHRSCHEDREPPFGGLPPALLKALVVDGDAEYQQFLRRLLEPRGFEVHEAGSGSEGMRLALASRPWLILTEVNVPGMDGFELCRRVRSHRLLRHTPLVFLSAWDGCDERLHGLKLGAHDYLSKRLPGRELLIRLHLVLRRYLDAGTPLPRGTGMEGRIELIGSTELLQMCHLGRFSGMCTVRTGMLSIQVRFRDGEIVGADSEKAHGAPAVYELLSWRRGRFDLVPGDPGDGYPLGENFDCLLLEGCRRLDEEGRQH